MPGLFIQMMNKLLTQSFSTFLRRRRAKKHFEPRPLLESLVRSATGLPEVAGASKATSTGIRFVQEGRAHRAAEGLRAMVSNKASVVHRSSDATSNANVIQAATPQEIPVRELVVGDIVALSAGDMIPADCRLPSAFRA